MNTQNYEIGGNIIENLTTGMYKDSKIIYREYIQNACDQIDKARENGLLNEDEGKIDIFINHDVRLISIEDDATGIPAKDFSKTLGDVANSSKKLGENKGFRGIGRLAGLAYCDKLVFVSSYAGEDIISRMECDAVLMRKLLNENVQGKKHSAIEILQAIYSFSTEKTKNIDEHFFKVELQGVSSNSSLLLDVDKIKSYLSFVTPVKYSTKFYHRKTIEKYANDHNYKLDEYKIRVNGDVILKNYTMNYKTRGNGDDAIRNIVFKEFDDDKGNLLAWMWYGITDFKGAIPDSCEMRGIRVRTGNIQIGNDLWLENFFNETRGAKYFIGEIFTISSDLIPNSQRDYFNETKSRIIFEKLISNFVNKELNIIYHKGSDMNGFFKTLEKLEVEELKLKDKSNKGALDKNDAENTKNRLESILEEKKKFENKISGLGDSESSSQLDRVIARVASNRTDEYKKKLSEIKKNYKSQSDNKVKGKSGEKNKDKKTPPKGTQKNGYRTDRLTSLDKKERKLIGRVYVAVKKALKNDDLTEKVIKAIEDELK